MRSCTFRRSTRTRPLVGIKTPEMIFSLVLLPEPLVPMLHTTSPRMPVKLTRDPDALLDAVAALEAFGAADAHLHRKAPAQTTVDAVDDGHHDARPVFGRAAPLRCV